MPNSQLGDAELAVLISRCAGVPLDAQGLAARSSATFDELGVDSLGLMGILAALENRYGVSLGEDANACETTQELKSLVNTALQEASDARSH